MDNLLAGTSVFLIGMMGSGKTTVGKDLAKALGYRFFDTDILLERVAGKTIEKIFREEGEKSFRKLETRVLAELSACTCSTIATGGGIVTEKQNWSYLRHGLIIWLDVPSEVLIDRLAEDNTRPLLKDPDPAKKLITILEQRRPLYANADLQIQIQKHHTPAYIVARILELIPSVLKKSQSFCPDSN